MSESAPLRSRKTSVIVAGIVALLSSFVIKPTTFAFLVAVIAFFYTLSPIIKPNAYSTKSGYLWTGLTLSIIGMLTPIIKFILGVITGEILI